MTRLLHTAGWVRVGVATMAASALALAGCSSSAPVSSPQRSDSSTVQPSQTTGTPPSSAPATGGSASSTSSARSAVLITIKNFAYRVTGTVAPGATVRVTNDDTTEHTVTADSGHEFNVAVQPGNTATFVAPHAAGRYRFHCNFHSDMHGTLVVR